MSGGKLVITVIPENLGLKAKPKKNEGIEYMALEKITQIILQIIVEIEVEVLKEMEGDTGAGDKARIGLEREIGNKIGIRALEVVIIEDILLIGEEGGVGEANVYKDALDFVVDYFM